MRELFCRSSASNYLQSKCKKKFKCTYEATVTIDKGLPYLHLFCASYKMGGLGEKRWQREGTKGLCPLYGKHLT
ncbi:hypothetical protein P2W68_01420 [Chryseobacterium arthrosphaerae]|uniref:hypothetical protein n=1 Tax=Chryseobacterium arthrosphaerae TaxID=651561 RepID=UPI0023E33EF9|nr:hypothetical protein [Chryseobacterium arthrosphaerae]WES98285.1 hypothetical protein P2W68_01420 [Chryseobacterium arthrosphaerae]